MLWFGRKGAGAAGRPPLTRAWGNWSGCGGAGDWPHDYATQLNAAILSNPVGQRCLRLVCEGAGSIALRVTAEVNAYRDLAYVVFEDLDLADFGNRIPTLTFEVFADQAGQADVGEIISSALDEVIFVESIAPVRALGGYAADGADIREAVGPLIDAFDLRFRDEQNGGFSLVKDRPVTTLIRRDEYIAATDGEAADPFELIRRPVEDVPVRIAQRYYDPGRDYQSGLQSAHRPGGGRTTLAIDLVMREAACLPCEQLGWVMLPRRKRACA